MLDVLRLDSINCTTALEVKLLAALVHERRLRSQVKLVPLVVPPEPELPAQPSPEPPREPDTPIECIAPAMLPIDQLPAGQANLRQIMRATCETYGISRSDICSDRRHSYLVMARHTAFLLCHMLTSKSYPDIGRTYGNRDHTTVLSGVRKLVWLKAELSAELSVNDTLMTWVRIAHSKMMRRYMKPDTSSSALYRGLAASQAMPTASEGLP